MYLMMRPQSVLFGKNCKEDKLTDKDIQKILINRNNLKSLNNIKHLYSEE